MLYSEYLLNKRDYQEFGHAFLLERKHACLFYKPGKGKTYPCVDAIRDINASMNGKAKLLVLSTADAVKNMWNAEIVPQNILPETTIITSFTSAIQDKTMQKLLRIKWNVIVIDESHKIKSNSSKISKLVYRLTKNCEYVFGLSGTPRGNNDMDIFCQFHNMNISEWGKVTYTNFVDRCCDIETKFFGGHTIKQPIGINHRYKAGWERNIAMYTQRVDYIEEDDMPDLDINLIELPYEATEEYLAAEQGVVSIPEYETTMTKLAAITKLHQAVNGFLYYKDDDDEQHIHIIERNKKLDWLLQNVNLNESTTIVYRFKADLENLKETFADLWTENINDFKNGKYKLLFLQCSRCESFNLQMCKHMIFYTLDYSYIKYNQMLHRIWRMGQTEDVKIDVLTFKNTIETRIWSTVKNKETLANLFMRIVSGV